MPDSKNSLDINDNSSLNLKDDNIDKNEYIKSLEISVQLLQREIESLRDQLTSKRVSNNQDTLSDQANPYKLLSEIDSRDLLVKKLDSILNSTFNFLENSIFEYDQNSKLQPYYFNSNLEDFYTYCESLEEEGIIDWASDSEGLHIFPNLEESTETRVINNVIYFIKLKGFRESVFIAKTTLSKDYFNKDVTKSLSELLSAAAIILDNIISKEEILNINKNIELQGESEVHPSSMLNISTSVVEYIYQSLGIIDANVKMIESGIGDTKRRIDIINDNSTKIREIGKKFINLIKNKDGNNTDGSLYEIVQDVVFLLRSQLLRDAIKITNKIDSSTLVSGELIILEKSILNIVLIIRDTLREGGNIVISASSNKDHTIIKISDDGIGFPIELVENFNRNHKINGEFQNIFDKLEIIKNLFRKINCEFEISSKERSGTTYSIYYK
ncbi:ATP-binding protein [Candidatus Kapabacteria bacterium]|nr:ATP-binding protein [Candidatus Kapabacteria bacterium]